MLNSSTLENIEIEYIKNLQQQVYFLEMECNYLRQQLDINGLQSKTKYDQASSHLRNEMVSIQAEKNNLEKSLLIENYEKEAVRDILEQKESMLLKFTTCETWMLGLSNFTYFRFLPNFFDCFPLFFGNS
jgi:hypothetical protein